MRLETDTQGRVGGGGAGGGGESVKWKVYSLKISIKLTNLKQD